MWRKVIFLGDDPRYPPYDRNMTIGKVYDAIMIVNQGYLVCTIYANDIGERCNGHSGNKFRPLEDLREERINEILGI